MNKTQQTITPIDNSVYIEREHSREDEVNQILKKKQ